MIVDDAKKNGKQPGRGEGVVVWVVDKILVTTLMESLAAEVTTIQKEEVCI